MLRHFYRLMVVALGLFLASSCGKSEPLYGIEATDFDDGTVDEDVQSDEDATEQEFTDSLYGCPTADYLIEGTVKSTAEVPINGIEITSDLYYRYVPTATTGDDGAFSITANDGCFDSPQKTAMLSIKDVDGALNGQYQDKVVSVQLVCTNDAPSGYAHYVCVNTDVKIELEAVVPDDDNLLSDGNAPDDDTLLPDE